MNSLILIGFRGAGKTTLGQMVADELSVNFWDLDKEWEKRHRSTILNFVETNGLEAFRLSEEELLREALKWAEEKIGIIATGGGVVDWKPSRDLLEHSPLPKIYLQLEDQTLWNRLKDSPDRLKIGNLADFGAFKGLLNLRRPFYEKIASYTLCPRDIREAFIELTNLAKAGKLDA